MEEIVEENNVNMISRLSVLPTSTGLNPSAISNPANLQMPDIFGTHLKARQENRAAERFEFEKEQFAFRKLIQRQQLRDSIMNFEGSSRAGRSGGKGVAGLLGLTPKTERIMDEVNQRVSQFYEKSGSLPLDELQEEVGKLQAYLKGNTEYQKALTEESLIGSTIKSLYDAAPGTIDHESATNMLQGLRSADPITGEIDVDGAKLSPSEYIAGYKQNLIAFDEEAFNEKLKTVLGGQTQVSYKDIGDGLKAEVKETIYASKADRIDAVKNMLDNDRKALRANSRSTGLESSEEIAEALVDMYDVEGTELSDGRISITDSLSNIKTESDLESGELRNKVTEQNIILNDLKIQKLRENLNNEGKATFDSMDDIEKAAVLQELKRNGGDYMAALNKLAKSKKPPSVVDYRTSGDNVLGSRTDPKTGELKYIDVPTPSGSSSVVTSKNIKDIEGIDMYEINGVPTLAIKDTKANRDWLIQRGLIPSNTKNLKDIEGYDKKQNMLFLNNQYSSSGDTTKGPTIKIPKTQSVPDLKGMYEKSKGTPQSNTQSPKENSVIEPGEKVEFLYDYKEKTVKDITKSDVITIDGIDIQNIDGEPTLVIEGNSLRRLNWLKDRGLIPWSVNNLDNLPTYKDGKLYITKDSKFNY
jgi:hypothetical protein